MRDSLGERLESLVLLQIISCLNLLIVFCINRSTRATTQHDTWTCTKVWKYM